MERREALQALAGLVLAGFIPDRAVARPRSPQPGPGRVTRIERERNGITVWMELEHGPFPCKGKKYRDATTAVFIPKHFRVRGNKIDTVLHFHGHKNTVPKAFQRYKLREQVADSLQNAILIAPQGPVNAKDSSGGKLEKPGGLLRFLTEVRKTLQTKKVARALGRRAIPSAARIGTLVISSHSGGYKVTARCLEHGGWPVSEVYLFDSLYGDIKSYRDWLAETKRVKDWRRAHKLVNYFATERPEKRSRELMALLDDAGVPYVVEEREGTLTRTQLMKSRAVFINARHGHRGVVFRTNALRDCLFASRLKRYVKSGWFRDKDSPRRIDKRR